MESQYVAFLALAALLTVTPGPDMAIVTRSALDGGVRAAVRTTLGINAGLLAWALAAALGVAAVLAASAEAFTALKLAGAAYLVWLGIQALRRSRRLPAATPAPPCRAFRDGLVANLLNPKIGVFYATVLPQFVVPGRSVVLQSVALALAHNLMGLLWLPAYARVVVWAGDVLRRPRVRRALDRVTGTALIGLGAAVALERR
ncbi:MAG TPA: LysE family translocator [Capillimicrobium sp.]|nr:LysE family translocator [Capillimicrobium sp.]